MYIYITYLIDDPRTKFVLQLEDCHSEFAVSAATDIVPIESWLRTRGEADQHPSQLDIRSLNLHTQPHLISENTPTGTFISMNDYISDFAVLSQMTVAGN